MSPSPAGDFTGFGAGAFAFLRSLARHNDREWFAADRFTMADVSIGYAIQLSAYIGVHDGLSDRVRTYFERLSARPAYQRAQARKEQP